MKPTTSSMAILWLPMLFLSYACCSCLGSQQSDSQTAGAETRDRPHQDKRATDSEELRVQLELAETSREKAINRCIVFLETWIDTPDPFDKNHYDRICCLQTLARLHAVDDEKAIRLLIGNMSIFEIADADGFSELDGLVASEALVELGAPVMPYLLSEVRTESNAEEKIRLVAFIIKAIDGIELGKARVNLAMREALSEAPRADTYIRNLTRLGDWFADPQRFDDPSNWPRR